MAFREDNSYDIRGPNQLETLAHKILAEYQRLQPESYSPLDDSKAECPDDWHKIFRFTENGPLDNKLMMLIGPIDYCKSQIPVFHIL